MSQDYWDADKAFKPGIYASQLQRSRPHARALRRRAGAARLAGHGKRSREPFPGRLLEKVTQVGQPTAPSPRTANQGVTPAAPAAHRGPCARVFDSAGGFAGRLQRARGKSHDPPDPAGRKDVAMTQAFRHVRARSKSGRALATARPMNRREFLALSLYIAIAAARSRASRSRPAPPPNLSAGTAAAASGTARAPSSSATMSCSRISASRASWPWRKTRALPASTHPSRTSCSHERALCARREAGDGDAAPPYACRRRNGRASARRE